MPLSDRPLDFPLIAHFLMEATSTKASLKQYLIQFFGAGGGDNNNSQVNLAAGTGGRLNIVDAFVMAQGRII